LCDEETAVLSVRSTCENGEQQQKQSRQNAAHGGLRGYRMSVEHCRVGMERALD